MGGASNMSNTRFRNLGWGRVDSVFLNQLHTALGTVAGFVLDDFGVHRAGVLDGILVFLGCGIAALGGGIVVA